MLLADWMETFIFDVTNCRFLYFLTFTTET